jgi:hypothetical protein
MTVSSTTTKNSYSGNGSLTVFAYGFKIFDEEDIEVILRNDTTGTETVQTITTNYSVSNVGNANGGNVTFVTAPASGITVVLRRASPLTQTTDYTPNDPFPAESHEDALDKLTFISQQLQEEIDRSIKLSRTNTMTSTEFTVGATARANKILAFDANGELTASTQAIGTYLGNWASGTAYSLRDIVKDTSNNNIYICGTAHTSSGSQPITSNVDYTKWDLLVDAASSTASQNAAAASAAAAAAAAVLTAADVVSTNADVVTTNTNATRSQDWAVKVNGIVDSTDYSAKAWSIGGTGVTDTAGAGPAKDWATETTGQVDGTEYSAKEYAVGTQTRGTTGSAKDWATYTGGTVDASEYSAKYYAQVAAASVATFDDKYAGAKTDDTAADTYFTSGGRTKDTGDLYYSTSSGNVRIWNGTAWEDAAVSTSSFATNGFSIAMSIAL